MRQVMWNPLSILALALLAAVVARSAEVSITSIGPDGGSFLSLVADPQNPGTLYAGAQYAGAFKTSDGGAHWSSAGLAGFTVNKLAIDPQKPDSIYAAVFINGSGVSRSTDGGKSWNSANTGLPAACAIGDLVVDPQVSGTIYAWTGCGGVFRSNDAGKTWKAVNSGLPFPGFGTTGPGSMAIDSNNSVLYVTAAQCDQSGKLPPPACDTHGFKSFDGGESWTEITSAPVAGTVFTSLATDPASPNILYARVMYPNVQNGVMKSMDGGRTWLRTSLDPGMGCCINALAVDPQSAIYTAGLGGLFKSTDGGANWSAISYFRPVSGVSALAFERQNPNSVYVVDYTGVSRSSDGGANWAKANSGLRAAPVFSVALDPLQPGTIYAGGFGIFKSTDGGVSWAVGTSSVPEYHNSAYALLVDQSDPNTIYASVGGRGEDIGFGGAILRSGDGGSTWSAAQSGLTTPAAVTSLAQSPGALYAGTWGGGVFKSIDQSMSWNAVNSGFPVRDYQAVVTALIVSPQDSGTLYAGTLAGRTSTTPYLPIIFKSTDAGLTWSSLSQDFSQPGLGCCPVITALAIDPGTQTVYTATATYGNSGGTVWKTMDGGATWRNLLLSSPTNVWAFALDPHAPATIYASTDAGLIMTTDGGDNWRDVPGAPGFATSLAVDQHNPNIVYAAGLGGLLAISVPE